MDFYQEPPVLKNTFTSDPSLSNHLKKILPSEVWNKISPHLRHMGQMAATEWLNLSLEAEANPPRLTSYSAWGKKIDEIQLNPAWKKLEAAAASEGIIAAAYERSYGEYSRVYQAAMIYLFHPSSAFVSCPLAMTDGAARAIELYGDPDLKQNAFVHLTSRDPNNFWTSGQWMTERTGGSDVSETSTTAKKVASKNEFNWQLNGVKWFTSATTSPMAMVLARPEGAESGSRGLSLFYVETKNDLNQLNNIHILRLKEKLGTRAMPTAELQLINTPAKLVGSEGQGVRKISSLFNITRIHNSLCAISHLRRALDLAQDFSLRRMAFGRRLIDHPLHKKTLDDLESQFKKIFALTFYVAHLLGRSECGTATELENNLLRALTPIVKLYTAKMCLAGVSEVLEIFGGAGYIEDTGIPKFLRDAQVFSIWEGTTNILALDFLRALQKENAGPMILEKIETDFPKTVATSQEKIIQLKKYLLSGPDPEIEKEARSVSFLVAEIFCDGLLNG